MTHRFAFLMVLSFAIVLPTPAGSAQRTDPIAELRGYIERFTGPTPRDCGLHLLKQGDRRGSVTAGFRWMPATLEALQLSVACGLATRAKPEAFWTFKQEQGIDSWVAHGLVGTSDGLMYRFSYDSAPCGGPGCPARITFERCDKPIAANSNVGSEFQCPR